MTKTIADLANKDYVYLTTRAAEKQAALYDAQVGHDAAVRAVSDCEDRLFALFASANITDKVYVLTTDGDLLKIDPVAKTVEKVEK